MKRTDFLIGKKIAGTSRVLVIAEIGVNHDGSLLKALKLIDAAAECGADAVKFQTFRTERLMTSSEHRFAQQADGGESAYEMFQRLELGWDDHEQLKRHADEREIVFLSTPFDEESVDFLDQLGVPAFKIASGDLSHFPLLTHVAAKRKPVLLSTGMSYLNEVGEAVWTLKTSGASEIILLHCVSAYPAPPDSLNLRAIQTLRDYFDLPVGFSDHSPGTLFPLVAVALGAIVIEKHFTLDRHAEGPDHKLSLDPAEMSLLIRNLREVDTSLGDGRKRPADIEEENRRLSRRSIVAAVDIRAHESLSPWMLTCKRPGTGLEPSQLQRVIGMKTRRDIVKDTILHWQDLMPSVSYEGIVDHHGIGRRRDEGPSPQPMPEGEGHA